MPKNPFIERVKGLYKKNQFGKTMMYNPVWYYKSMKDGHKLHKRSHASLRALAQTARIQLVNGPEVNLLLCGIPFLLDVSISQAVKGIKKLHAARQNGNAPNPAPGGQAGAAPAAQPIRFKVKKTAPVPTNGTPAVPSGTTDPLAQAPFSDQFVGLYDSLLKRGMSEEGARLIAERKLEGEEVTEHLTDEDAEVLMDWVIEGLAQQGADGDQ